MESLEEQPPIESASMNGSTAPVELLRCQNLAGTRVITKRGAHGTLRARFTTEPTVSESGTFESFSAGTYGMRLLDQPIVNTRRDFQETDLISFVEHLHLISSSGFEANTPNV
jgi:hypothetical protein